MRVSATKVPRSPVTTVTRSLNGESQLTRWLVIVPLESWPTIATRSSCSRPDRCVVRAETEVKLLLGHPGGEVDVVGAEVLDDPDVGDARWERAPAAG